MQSTQVRKFVLSAVPFFAMLTVLQACSDPLPTGVGSEIERPAGNMVAIPCQGNTRARTVECATPQSVALGINHNADVIGRQNTLVRLSSANVTYDTATGFFEFDVTVQNLMNEAMGTPDGTVADPQGIQVFFNEPPVATSGSGSITIDNADGEAEFTATGQKYFTYPEILVKDQVSDAKRWRLVVPSSVGQFKFAMYVETDRQYLLVINEVMANPVGLVTTEQPMEWVELYNAGSLPVPLQNLVITDSAASGRRPYHLITDNIVVGPGEYVVLGGSTNTSVNGGAPVDYSYGTALNQLANSLDAVKIARVYGSDTLTIDRTQYSNAAVSAKEGISRELKNPALDNSNMDGSNWDDASVTSVYGSGGRGTPKAENSSFTPGLMCTSQRFRRC